ncbi:MAG: hypothetical protein E6R05_03210 [Candidatus Moraniibacteriota bacterium]|nr:MAG: hypothetical protein E6R05_03210 [Candidatus Moranbacteria bacterium]
MRLFFGLGTGAYLFLFLVFPSLVGAAEQSPENWQAPAATDTKSSVQTVAVADVNVGDVQMTEKDGVLTGTFVIQGKMGQQNDIVYGVVVIDAMGQTLDVQSLGQIASVMEGEAKTLSFEYTLPASLRGKVKVLLKAETVAGLPLGTQVLLDKDLGGVFENVLTCRGADGGMVCTSSSDQRVKVSYYTGSIFSQPVSRDEVALSADVATDIKPTFQPGRYSVVIRGSEAGGFSLASFRMAGSFGQIQNIVLDIDKTGSLVGLVAATASPLAGAKIEMELRSENDQVCGQGTASLEGQVAEVVFSEVKCMAGIVKTTLKGADGSTLASLSQSFNASQIAVENALPQGGDKSTTVSKLTIDWAQWLMWAVVVVILALAALWRGRSLMKKGDRVMPKLFLLVFSGLSFLAYTSDAQALTLAGTTYGPRGCGGCEIAIYSYTDISSNKATYAPGETMSITSTHSLNKDVGANPTADRGVINIGYAFDVDLGPVGGSPAYHHIDVSTASMPFFSGPVVTNFIAPAAVGLHFMSNRINLEAHDVTGVYHNSVEFARLNFAVAAPTPCSFNGTVNWGAGANVFPGSDCTGNINVSGVPVGASRTITDSDGTGSGYTGSINFRCDSGPSGWTFTGSSCARPPTVTLGAFSPSSITTGGSSRIILTTTDATSCVGDPGSFWVGPIATSYPSPGASTGPISTPGTYTQRVTCTGPGGNTTSTTSTLTVTSGSVSGVCGTANGRTYNIAASVIPVAARCSSGTYDAGTWGSDGGAWYTTSTFPSGARPFNTGGAEAAYYLGRFWSCDGSSGGTTTGCSLYYEPQCGSAHGSIRATAPTANNALEKIALCQIGTASAVTTGGSSYTWSCTNGAGPTANCSATRSGGGPTGQITARVVVAHEDLSPWKKFISFLTGRDHVLEATGSPATISSSGQAAIDWASSGAATCQVTGPSMPMVLSLSGTRSFTGTTLGTGDHDYALSCDGGAVTDSARITVTAPSGCCGTGGGSDDVPSLSATSGACGTGTINLSWGSIPGATSYQLRDGASVIYSGSSTSFAHTGLVTSSSHNYTVRSTGPSGSSAYSGVVNRNAPDNCVGSTYTIVANSGVGGAIAPSGVISGIPAGDNRSFTITPNPGYSIASVVVDGVDRGALGSYTFNNITADHTITALFSMPSGPSVTLTATPSSIILGGSTLLSWTTSGGVMSCLSTGGGAGWSATWQSPSGGAIAQSPSVTTTYNIECWDGPAGTGTSTGVKSVTVTVLPVGVISVDLTASPDSIAAGGTSTLTWSTTGGRFCHIWSYDDPTFIPINRGVAATGSIVVTPPTPRTYNYSFECFDMAMIGWVDSATVTVTGGAPPSGSILSYTNPCVIPVGSTTCPMTVSWTTNYSDGSTGGVTVGIENSTGTLGQSLGFATPGSHTWTATYPVGPPTSWLVSLSAGAPHGSGLLDRETFAVTCAPDSAWVGPLGCQPTPTVNLTVNGSTGPLTVPPGDDLNIAWTVSGATSCTASGKWSGGKSTTGGTEGPIDAAIPSGDYILSCSNAAGTTNRQVTVNVACTASVGPWSACGPPCAGGDGTRSRTVTTATCIVTSETESCTTDVCRDLNWKEVGQ